MKGGSRGSVFFKGNVLLAQVSVLIMGKQYVDIIAGRSLGLQGKLPPLVSKIRKIIQGFFGVSGRRGSDWLKYS